MIAALLFAVATTAAPALPPPTPLAGLEGCWAASGRVEGKPVTAVVRGSRRLGGRYLMLELHGLDPKDPYDAAIILAEAGGGVLTGWWMDSFGGPGSAAGQGRIEPDGLSITYAYQGTRFVNRFRRAGQGPGGGWDWRIDSQADGGRPLAFARYALVKTRCPPGFSVF